MFTEPRLYQGERDLAAIYDLLRQGRLADNGTYYVHPGDLSWWLFYPPLEHDFWQSLYLWDDPQVAGRILAWVLLPPNGSTLDVALQPELRGSPWHRELFGWGLHQAIRQAKQAGRERIGAFWICEQDTLLRGWLVEQGFELASRDAHLACDLGLPGQPGPVPGGYVVRSSRGLAEVSPRARAQYGAFGSQADFERYVQRFARFMQSPVYDPEWDVVAEAPDGQIGAFCIAWPDFVTGVGLFEPVGTHPDFQRKGLGKAVLLEALGRLRQHGMHQAIVTTPEDNLPAIRLYESVGFHTRRRLLYYKKQII